MSALKEPVAGWIVTFMLRIRSASPLAASTCASGFWAGMALGRISLGTLTDRFGERLSVTVYLLGALISQVIFSLMTPIVVSVVSITMLGFLLGPLYPTGIVMVTRLMPRELHVSAVATVAAAGQIGNAVFPFILGAAAERLGIQALQPFVFGLLALALAVWWCFPRLPARMVRTQGIEAETAGNIPTNLMTLAMADLGQIDDGLKPLVSLSVLLSSTWEMVASCSKRDSSKTGGPDTS